MGFSVNRTKDTYTISQFRYTVKIEDDGSQVPPVSLQGEGYLTGESLRELAYCMVDASYSLEEGTLFAPEEPKEDFITLGSKTYKLVEVEDNV